MAANSNNDKPVKLVPSSAFLDLSWEDLFYQPVSLKALNIKIEDDFDVDEEDFSFLLDLDFEQLFKLPVSVQQYQESLEASSAGEDIERNFDIANDRSTNQVLHVELIQDPLAVKTKPINTKANTDNDSNVETETELPPIIDIPEEIQPGPVATLPINETDMFISEATSVEANLFDLAGFSVPPGVIIEVFGVTDNGIGDMDLGLGAIEFDTLYGYVEVNVNTGDFSYELQDASGVLDSQQTVTEQIPYKIELFSDSSVVDYFLNVTIDLNQAPIAVDDFYQTDALTTLIVNTVGAGVLGNDLDPDNDSEITDLQFVTKINGMGGLVGSPYGLPQGGELDLNADGTFTFDPGMDFLGLEPGETVDVTFTYTMADSEGLESTANVTIEVVGVVIPEINIPIEETPMANDRQPSYQPIGILDVLSNGYDFTPYSHPTPLMDMGVGDELLHPEII